MNARTRAALKAKMQYDPESSFVEEYDPVNNWRVDDLYPDEYKWIADLCDRLREQEENTVLALLQDARQSVFNVSACYVLARTREAKTEKNKARVHKLLRRLQKKQLGVDDWEYSQVEPRAAFVKAIKEYIKTKDLYNLSPEWLMQLGKARRERNQVLAAMKSIDCFMQSL